MKIGLAFPERGIHTIEDFKSALMEQKNKIDLVVFPEGFESIKPDNRLRPEDIQHYQEFASLYEKCLRITKECGIHIIVGFSVDYGDDSINGSKNDQYCMYVSPSGDKVVYHKHSSSEFNAFFDENWSIDANLPVVTINGTTVGLSICHDSYISLIQRVLKKKGAVLWVNISFENVVPVKWESVLQARAVENKMIAICTLHRNSGKNLPQKEPYAFSEAGKIRLKVLGNNEYIENISVENRVGKIFWFDTSEYEIYPETTLKCSALSSKAQVVSIQHGDSNRFEVDPDDGFFVIKTVNVEEFTYLPERLWRIALEDRKKVPLFVIRVRDNKEWNDYKPIIQKILKARIIEFSTLFLFTNENQTQLFMAAYSSSNYKGARIFCPDSLPFGIDTRYLKGLESTFTISRKDNRRKGEGIYFEKVNQIIKFLENNDTIQA
jgi:predicted amidohydrolase